MGKITDRHTIIVDTREKLPYEFENYNVEVKKLDTGDYTLKGYEHLLVIEKKRNVIELANSIAKQRFWREIDRMKNYKYKFLILDFPIDDIINYPDTAKLPFYIKRKIRIRGPFLLSRMSTIQLAGIQIIYASHQYNSQMILEDLFKQVIKKEEAAVNG